MLVAALAVSGCRLALFTCGDAVKTEATSPDGRYVATVSERNCGATTDYSILVSLRSAQAPFDPAEQSIVLSAGGRTTVRVEWRPDGTLSIGYSASETFTKIDRWRDVRISYD